jgi:LacI family transcriptional regulator
MQVVMLETNGHQNYRHWDCMIQYHPCSGAPWTQAPGGIFALNDYIASGVYQACRELRLRTPDDVSIICVDDSDITRALHPQTTVVAQRTGEIARKAVELLDRRLQSETPDLPPQHITIAGDLIERDSVARVGPPL